MARMILDEGYMAGEAVSLTGLRRVLASMRWEDLEAFAAEVESFRLLKGTEEDDDPEFSSNAMTAQIIIDWVNNG